ncbi:MAG: LarC family nickel insertion protein, partial [Spirochaetales bacterium]|nr:LarC family nickel insertion protein [Spirochaetales bacterium]
VMKKGRPGFRLSVLVDESRREALADYILEETTTIGVRYYPVERKTLPRDGHAARTAFGEVEVKEVTTPSGRRRRKAEFESAAEISKRSGRSISAIKRAAESDSEGS